MKKKTRSLGKLLLEMEVLLDEMVDKHQLQMGDILALISSHLEIHRPDCIEEYLDGSHPIRYYGPRGEE